MTGNLRVGKSESVKADSLPRWSRALFPWLLSRSICRLRSQLSNAWRQQMYISGKTKWTKQQATLIGPTLMCLPDPCRGASYWTRACSLEWLLNPNALWYGLHRLSVQVWVCDESKSSCGLLKKVNLPQWVHGCVDVPSSRRQQVLWIKMRKMVQGAQAGEATGQNPKWIIMLTVQLPYSK